MVVVVAEVNFRVVEVDFAVGFVVDVFFAEVVVVVVDFFGFFVVVVAVECGSCVAVGCLAKINNQWSKCVISFWF